MTIYLTIITTVLVVTEIIRVVMNAVDIINNYKLLDAQLKQISGITEEDLQTQKKAYRLMVEYFENKGGVE